MTRMLLTIALTAALAACGGGDDGAQPVDDPTTPATVDAQAQQGYSPECGAAFEQAASVDAGQDSNEDLYPAVTACADVEAFTAAAADHPDALDDVDADTWLGNTCQYAEDPEVTGSNICTEISDGS